MPTLLLLLLALPLATACVVAVLGSARASAVRWLSLACTLACLVIAVVVAVEFAGPRFGAADVSADEDVAVRMDPQMTTRVDLVTFPSGEGRSTSIQFYVGIDGMNVWLVVLTAFLMVPAVLISWTSITERVAEFHAWLLILQLGMVGVFLAFDVILFYVFFELTLVPLFFLIGIWGGAQRQYAARKFFIYTLAGSLITLVGVLGVVLSVSQLTPERELTFSIPRLVELVDGKGQQVRDARRVHANAVDQMDAAAEGDKPRVRESQLVPAEQALERAQAEAAYWQKLQFWLFLAMITGFAIKVPLVPVHTWLPLAHVEAPTAGSVLLAGVLLKIGTYGFLRLCLPLAPDASLHYGAPLIGWLSVIGIIYGSFCALAQDDIKKLVAYSSVSHLGFAMLGLFALNEVGLTGSMLQMVNHGLSTGALFLLVGMLYERYHTRQLDEYGGFAARLKWLAFFMVFITMSSIGLPGLNGFVGELLVLMGMFDSETGVLAWLLTALACTGIVLGAWYMLNMLRRAFFGPEKEHAHAAKDLGGREFAALAPIAVLCLVLGVYPRPFIDTISPEMKVVAQIAQDARDRK